MNPKRPPRRAIAGLLALVLALPAAALANHAGHGAESGQSHEHAQGGHDHGTDHGAAAHRMPDHLGMDEGNAVETAMRPDGFQYRRSLNHYPAPDVMLRNQHGARVNFVELMEFEGPVLLNFIFTSCATICPVMSATFAQSREDLAVIDDRYLMVSVSIDPDYDTPARLHDYAALHGGGDNWILLTGQFGDIFSVVRAFDAVYKGENKMYHRPLTFLRSGPDAPWLRLEGLMGSEELAHEYDTLLHPEVN